MNLCSLICMFLFVLVVGQEKQETESGQESWYVVCIERMDDWMNEQINKAWMNKQTNECMHKWISEKINGLLNNE